MFENVKAVLKRISTLTLKYDKVDMKTTQVEILKMKQLFNQKHNGRYYIKLVITKENC